MNSLLSLIAAAQQKGTALGHFNVGNLEQLRAIANAGIQLNVPVVIGVSEGEREFFGVRHIVALIQSYNREYARAEGFRLFLNADHTHSLAKVREAAEAGFDAILFDGGKLPLEENIAQTKEAVRIAKTINPAIVVEGELGYIGSASEVRKEIPAGAAIHPEDLTKPEEAKRFVEATGVDMLAPAVGNIHGMFAHAPDPALNIARIREIKEVVHVPLVLHGGSGNTDEDFVAAINAGIGMIHISTELRVAWRRGLEASLKAHPDEVAPYKIAPFAITEIERVVHARLALFSTHELREGRF